jgi:ankyrin repeat protein
MTEKAGLLVDRDGRDTGWYAAMEGDVATLKVRLDAGLSIDHSDNGGVSLVWIAAYHGQLDSLRLLIQRGAAVDTADSHGNAALWHATRQAVSPTDRAVVYLPIIEALLAAGADPDHKNKVGMSAPGWTGPIVGNAVNREEVQSLYRSHGYVGDFS